MSGNFSKSSIPVVGAAPKRKPGFECRIERLRITSANIAPEEIYSTSVLNVKMTGIEILVSKSRDHILSLPREHSVIPDELRPSQIEVWSV